jgi:C1A family cysteine protease
MTYKLIYKFQNPDHRDHLFISELAVTPTTTLNSKSIVCSATNTPPTFSLRSSMSPILNQGSIGDCVSNAFALTISSMTKNKVNISRLYHYAVTRIIEDTPVNEDSGVYIRDAANSILTYGAVAETTWPYNPNNFVFLPPLAAFRTSNYFRTYSYTFINQDLNSIRQCFTKNQKPIIFGFTVYNSFMSQNVTNTGIVPMPNTQTETLLGGHCMVIVGYDDTKSEFICANSWGTGWGDHGYCHMPYSYITNSDLANDFCYLTFTY